MKPTVICEYNSHMGGVDTADHYLTSYGFNRKTKKWWRKVFFWSLDVSFLNSYLLFKMNNPSNSKLRSLAFRKELCAQLIGNVRNENYGNKIVPQSDNQRLDGKFHAFYARKSNYTCKVCSRSSQRKTRIYYCKTCVDQPAIHPGECFEKYHSVVNYK